MGLLLSWGALRHFAFSVVEFAEVLLQCVTATGGYLMKPMTPPPTPSLKTVFRLVKCFRFWTNRVKTQTDNGTKFKPNVSNPLGASSASHFFCTRSNNPVCGRTKGGARRLGTAYLFPNVAVALLFFQWRFASERLLFIPVTAMCIRDFLFSSLNRPCSPFLSQ